MTSLEFQAVRAILDNISEIRCAVARAALVDGETLAVVGEKFQCSRQAVNTVVNVFWDGLGRLQEALRILDAGQSVPPEWERATLIAPKRMINRLRAEIKELDKVPAGAGAGSAAGCRD